MSLGKLSFGSSLFKPPRRGPLLGLDISDSSIKFVELSQSGKNIQMERYTIGSLPKEAVTDGNFDVDKLDVIAESIHAAWSRLGSRTKQVALALPTSMAIYKKVLLPAGQDYEIEPMVETEASHSIPFPLDEVNLDYQILGPGPNDSDVEVMMCAARKERVEERVAAVEMAGLKAAVVDIDIFSSITALELIQQQLPGHGENQTFAIFDVGSNKMHCNVVRNGQPLYFREQAIGGQQLTREIQRRYNMSAEEAERNKRAMSLPEGYETELLQPFVSTLAQEVQRILQFFYTTVSASLYQRVDYILLAGGCSTLPGLDDAVTSRTQINTMIANPFSSMGHSSNIRLKELLLDSPALFNACGLAMRRFDA